MQTRFPLIAALLCVTPFCSAQDSEIGSILKVGPEAANNAEAARAVATLSHARADQLPRLLEAMNAANELAANYLRSAVDTIVDDTLAVGRELPLSAVRSFLLNTANHPKARRLAYEILARVTPEETGKLLPGFANDPSVELRFDAVELLITAAHSLRDAKKDSGAADAYQKALDAARDQKQIEKIAAELKALGRTVDLPRHFGFLMQWRVIGPFDNTGLTGFETAYPPEKELQGSSEYEGKLGKVRWQDTITNDDYGKLDLNPVLGELKEVTAYATTEFNSPIEGQAELRLGCKNGWKIWLNGTFLFGRDEYHRGARIDQYRLPVTLKKGPNRILLKVCQNADVKDWTKEWEFQLRVCDATGTAILATDRQPTAPSEPKQKSRARTSATSK
jgi:hypothetical protein